MFTLPGVRRYIFDDRIIPPEQTAEIVDKSVALFRDRGLGLWIARAARCVDWLRRLLVLSRSAELELLYGVVDREVGRGYGREIAQALVRYGFDTLNMPVIRASCDTAHTASRRLLDAIGFRFERRDRIAGLDTVFYALDGNATKGADPFSGSATC